MGLNSTLDLPILGEGIPKITHPTDKKNWDGLDLPWMAFGYGVSLTPLQTLTFYNAIANDGIMLRPRFLREVKDFDKKVLRTKKRPLASGMISVKKSLVYMVGLCFLAFLILIQFNFKTILLGMSSMLLAFSYPYMKRITYWPQLFLGLTFNWGIIMAYAALNNNISVEIVLLYASAIFWTLGYDTIYGTQDIVDDEIIGIKSTSIKFRNNIKLFLSCCYFASSLLIVFLFFFFNFLSLI